MAFAPAQWVDWEESALAYPLMRGDRVAGCVLFSSTQRDYFVSPVRRSLVEQYARLVTLAFEPEDFYPLKNVEFYLMPDYKLQRPLVPRFRDLVSQNLLTAQRAGKDISTKDAEQQAWQQIEQELAELAASLTSTEH